MSLPSIILDTDKTTPIYELPLKIRQGDTGDELQVTLGKSFEKYTDLSKVDVELIAKTPDQRLIKQPVTDKSENTFKVKFPDEMYTNVGVFRNMYFKIGDDSTSSIKLVVLQGIGSIKEAGSYIDDFETLIEEAESYVLALKDFSDTGNAKIDDKVAELTGKMTDFVDKSKEDLDAAKSAWSTFQSSSQTAFTDDQDKRTSDFNSQKAGFETDFGDQQTDFENRFKALLATLQGDYDDFKNLINKDVKDFNKSLDSLDAQATDVKNKYDALKDQLDLATQNISGVRTNLLTNSNFSSGLDNWNINLNCKATVTTDSDGDTCIHITGTSVDSGIYCVPVNFNQNQVTTASVLAKGIGTNASIGLEHRPMSNFGTISTESYSKIGSTAQASSNTSFFVVYFNPVNGVVDVYIKFVKLEKGPTATDWCPNPSEIATNDGVQTAITNALDKADYSTTAEVDSKISTGVGQAKTYAEQSIKDIIGAAPETLDTIAELADAVTENKDGVQAINEGITKKADKTDVTALQNTVQTMITTISQEDYDALVSAGTVNPKIMYVIPDA
jgi:hypothetical protein